MTVTDLRYHLGAVALVIGAAFLGSIFGEHKPERSSGSAVESPRRGETEQERTQRLREEEERKHAEEVQCRNDLQCWASKVRIDAAWPCKQAIQNLAKYDYKWDDGFLSDPLFVRIGWVDQKAGSVGFAGDRIQMQNGFGNWVRHSYICKYDPNTKRVLDVLVNPGRLPN